VRKSRTTPYHPAGNGQVERFNGIIWKTLKLRLAEKGCSENRWAEEMHFALMNIRALSSRAIGYQSPHNQFMGFTRKSTLDANLAPYEPLNVTSLPSWLKPGNKAFLKRQPRHSKSEPLIDIVLIKEIQIQSGIPSKRSNQYDFLKASGLLP